MATLALSVAGQFVGGALGGPIGATIGRAVGALAGSAIDNALFAEKPQRPQPSDIALQGSSQGGAIPRIYGWARVTGNIIWATELESFTVEGTGGKGMGAPEETGVMASFALALCEGEVQRLGRIWADGKVLETEGLNIRFYRGTESQLPDSLVEAKQGAGKAPAYRGLCYLVFERLDLTAFGNRIPNLSVELCRAVGELEPKIRAVTVIPGATEFGYDPEPRLRLLGRGRTVVENTHLSREVSDWTLSIDELQALCSNLDSVALVVAWFGDDLRCGHCTIRPRVEAAVRDIEGTQWAVAGLTRAEAQVVSSHQGAPAYGGTPSDAAVMAAIADLKARGLKVTLYPMVLMDVPAGNALPNPYGGTGQPAYPWRGRITCDPAPGQAGSPDQSAAAEGQVAGFVGGEADWGFRRFVQHYAQLAVAAGGVDALIIGSGMRGMTTVRGVGNSFPFVSALVDLAAEVRGIVGPETKLTYAADWSEYSGYQPEGQKFFHLDPLWASQNIDAVGIDNYMPIADWREDGAHADAALADSIYDPGYLQAGIARGEGFDWYYASEEDRQNQLRTPISDGAHGEPWVWRFKDIAGWWSNPHFDRPGGVRAASPTAWVPKSKPIWFTELGCGAVDKGANQPNVFGDAKSAESGVPHFSTGRPDWVMQRQFLRAHLDWWAGDEARNPASDLYPGRMVEEIYLWTWDARPFPAFPQQRDAWADGGNHATGHWLTGRLGTVTADEMIKAVAKDFGIDGVVAAAAAPLVQGLKVEGVVSCREALADLLAACGLSVRDRRAGLQFVAPPPAAQVEIGRDERVGGDGPLQSRRRADAGEGVGRLALSFFDRDRDYLTGSVTAMRLEQGALAGASSNLVLDANGARLAAERMIIAEASGDVLELALPPSRLALEVGDAFKLAGEIEGEFCITEIKDGLERRVTARAGAPKAGIAVVSDLPQGSVAAPVPRARPEIVVAHLPPLPDSPHQTRLLLGAAAKPWPGEVSIEDDVTGATIGALTRPATMGELIAPIAGAAWDIWDDATEMLVSLYSGHLSSASETAVLAGANRLAVETDSGGWEIVGFAHAELVAPELYRLAHLRRGCDGSDHAIGPASVGRRVLLIDGASKSLPVPAAKLGLTLSLRGFAGSSDLSGQALSVAIDLAPILPLAPTALEAARDAGTGDVTLGWTRRSRAGEGFGNGPPLEHVPEAYTVAIVADEVQKRVLTASAAQLAYTAAEQTADFGALTASFQFSVRQVSAVYGPGHEATGAFNG